MRSLVKRGAHPPIGVISAGLVILAVTIIDTASPHAIALRDAIGGIVAPRDSENSTNQTKSELAGTSWRLLVFRGPDRKTQAPRESAIYTIEFGAAGTITARVDCNRGRGTWRSEGKNHVEFSALSLTRMMCQDASLHDRIAKDWVSIKSYAVKNDHLFLMLPDSGAYEFERSSTR